MNVGSEGNRRRPAAQRRGVMPTEEPGAPRFQLLDVVVACGFSGRGVVSQVRKYGDGRFRYSVAPLDDRDEIATIFDEADLTGTGERASASSFTTFGAFRIRDVVRVSSGCEHSAIAGRTGVIEGGDADDEGSLLVWISHLKEVWVVRADDLHLTSERMPPSGPRRAMSLAVSEAGEVLGKDEYVVLDDVCDL